jgi:lipopolysaccharide export system protein LptC
MSVQAELDRSLRKIWAAKGGRHDRVVAILRYGLPVVIGVVAASLIFAPFARRSEVSFLLSKDSVEVAKERLRVVRAIYRGQDAKGQPFALVAEGAVQKSSALPVVEMTGLSGAIRLADGPATISAENGQYDMRREQVSVIGPITVSAANGYWLIASNVSIDLKARQLTSNGAVKGAWKVGTFSGNSLLADLDKRTLNINGAVKGALQIGTFSGNRLFVDEAARVLRIDGDVRVTIVQGALR